MKTVILCKSDSTGGAAIVSFRLMEALRLAGVDARMLVCEKKTSSPFVVKAAPDYKIKSYFLVERLGILIGNRFDSSNLFDIDSGAVGLPLWNHPLVKEADLIIVSWVNQAMLSLEGMRRILQMDKPVIFVMHDMWAFTGVCHHSHGCTHYTEECGDCMLLRCPSPEDLSHAVWNRKRSIYSGGNIAFVGVSSWVCDLARNSSLLKDKRVEHIPNAFPVHIMKQSKPKMEPSGKKRIVFGAARLDAPVKGLETFRCGLKLLAKEYPELASDIEVVFYGALKNRRAFDNFPIGYSYVGPVNGLEQLRNIYESAKIVISTSNFENLPGTLIEGQAFGCVPIAFDRGGQRDIITHGETGYLMQWNPDIKIRAREVVDTLVRALDDRNILKSKMRESVRTNYSYEKVARLYLDLYASMLA